MFARFEGCTEDTPPPKDPVVPYCERPLSVVTVPDEAMRPALRPGQQVYVQNFRVRGANYLEQRMALRVRGRVLVRRVQQMADGSVRLFGNQDGFEIELIPPDGWELPSGWRETGVLHPECTAIGPLVTARASGPRRPHNQYVATAGWSN